MTRAQRHRLTAAGLVFMEVYFYVRYAQSGADFHFWLHALLGGTLGLWLLSSCGCCGPASSLVGALALLGVGVVLRAPAPTTLQQVVDGGSNGPLSGDAWSWVCRVEV